MCDSLTVYTPPKSSLCVFFSLFFFSSLLVTNTHTYILVPFIIHDLHDGRRLCLRRIRHSWLCVLEPNMCVLKKGCSPRPSFIPPLFLALSLLYILCTTYIYIHTSYIYMYIHTCWYIDRFFFALAMSTSLRC